MYDIAKYVSFENAGRWLKEVRDHADSKSLSCWLGTSVTWDTFEQCPQRRQGHMWRRITLCRSLRHLPFMLQKWRQCFTTFWRASTAHIASTQCYVSCCVNKTFTQSSHALNNKGIVEWTFPFSLLPAWTIQLQPNHIIDAEALYSMFLDRMACSLLLPPKSTNALPSVVHSCSL